MEKMREHGQAVLEQNEEQKKFYLMTIIGEIEGHDVLGGSSKATKYEQIQKNAPAACKTLGNPLS